MWLVHKLIHLFKKIKHWLMGNYPLSKYHFIVDWGGQQIGVSEISGLAMEYAVVEHRTGADKLQSVIKLPGLQKFSNLILKRALQADDRDFFNWINTIQMNTVERRDIVISLLNASHEPIVSWRVRNAWPCKYQVADLNASSNEVLIETIELAHEGFQIVT